MKDIGRDLGFASSAVGSENIDGRFKLSANAGRIGAKARDVLVIILEIGGIMTLRIETDPVSLRLDELGVVRVGDSQVVLDVVIQQFNNGAEPEAIAKGFPTLNLADVYAAIAYYLRHRRDVDDYLNVRRQEAATLRRGDRGNAAKPSRLTRQIAGSEGPVGASGCFAC